MIAYVPTISMGRDAEGYKVNGGGETYWSEHGVESELGEPEEEE